MTGLQIELGDVRVQVIRKDIRNLHLSVYPPFGKVRISAPAGMGMDAIRAFAITKLRWIKAQQKKLRQQERETPRSYIDEESHFVWGRRYLLKLIERDAVPTIELKHKAMLVHVRPGASEEKRRQILEDWYRALLREAVSPLVSKWEALLGVNVERFFVQRMRTKWGSCNAKAGTIRLNTDLAKKPPECLEYIVVHEMAHLLEPTHGERFIALMDRFMPNWRFFREELNRLPVRHEEWFRSKA